MPTADDFAGSGNTRTEGGCEWAAGIGEGEHVDMIGDGYATCCDIGTIDGSEEPTSGAELIAVERRRQVDAEGWTAEHDDEHTAGELADAAALYIARVQYGQHGDHLFSWKTSAHNWIKDGWDQERMLVKAGALIAAEIDRLRRLEASRG